MSTPVTVQFPRVTGANGTGATVVVSVGMLWRPTEPLHVHILIVPTGGRMIRWTLSRDLLAAGLDGPAGDGDISIMPAGLVGYNNVRWHDGIVEVVLRDQRGIGYNLSLPLPTEALLRFLDRTAAYVALGAEQLDFDPAELTADVDGEAAA